MKYLASTILASVALADKTQCALDISLATASLGSAGVHIKAAVADCKTDAAQCSSDISSAVSNLGSASAHISKAVDDCGG